MPQVDRSEWDVIVVGAGAAGVAAAEELGRIDPRPSVLILSEEDRPPYKRTKISKNIARGFDREEFAQLAPEWYAENGFDLMLAARVSALDPQGRNLELADGRRFGWGSLILATGADPVPPPVQFAQRTDGGLFVVRTAAQVESLRAALVGAGRVAVVGSGVLGVEVAEQVRRLGLEVVLVGCHGRLMHRQLNEPAADRLADLMRSEGVELSLGERVGTAERRDHGGFALGLRQESLEADVLIFCVGVRPRTELAVRSGLAVDHGILVDRALRTSHAAVFAAGDAAQHPDGSVTHLWHAAQHQGTLAARSAVGRDVRHDNPPFRLKCEVFGQYFFSMNVPPGAFGDDALDRAAEALPAVTPAARPAPSAGSSGEARTEAPEGLEREEQARGPLYRCLYYRGDRLFGVIMVNDRERARRYEAAVREGWPRRTVRAELPLS